MDFPLLPTTAASSTAATASTTTAWPTIHGAGDTVPAVAGLHFSRLPSLTGGVLRGAGAAIVGAAGFGGRGGDLSRMESERVPLLAGEEELYATASAVSAAAAAPLAHRGVVEVLEGVDLHASAVMIPAAGSGGGGASGLDDMSSLRAALLSEEERDKDLTASGGGHTAVSAVAAATLAHARMLEGGGGTYSPPHPPMRPHTGMTPLPSSFSAEAAGAIAATEDRGAAVAAPVVAHSDEGAGGAGGSAADPLAVFRPRRADESEAEYRAAHSAWAAMSAATSKPRSTASAFAEGSLVLNHLDRLPDYFSISKKSLVQNVIQRFLVFMAHIGDVGDVTHPLAISRAKIVFPELTKTAKALLPLADGIIYCGTCFGFSIAFNVFLCSLRDPTRFSEEELANAFMAGSFDHLAPLIQVMLGLTTSKIQKALPDVPRKVYETALQEAGGVVSFNRKLRFTETKAPPKQEVSYDTKLRWMQEVIYRKKGVGVKVSLISTLSEDTPLDYKGKESYLSAQIRTLFQTHKGVPLSISIDGHAMSIFGQGDFYLLWDGNKGVRIFKNLDEAVIEVEAYIRSFKRFSIMNVHAIKNS